MPDGVTTMPPGPSGGVSVSGCEATSRPNGPLPAPGQMPAGSTMERILRRGYLIAGVDEDSYLFGYRNPSPDPKAPPLVGFDIDFVREVAKAIFGSPDKVRYQAITKAQRISSLTSGSVDIVADIFTVDCERAKQVAFSSDYFDAGQRILVNQSSPVNSLADLAGRKACAAAGTTSIQTLANPAYHVVPISAVNWADCLVMLQQGQVDAISTTDLILLGLQVQDPYTKIVGPRFTYERHGLGLPQHEDDFVQFVNGVLEKIRADGTWTAIYTHWVGDKLGPVPAPPPAVYK
jgi:polar amino acid transport system substrate-binding protein